MLRSYVQQNPNIHFIFSGSNKHLLLSMFSNYGRPFYQSGEIMYLNRLNSEIISKELIYKVLDDILIEREYIYYNYRNLLTSNQFQLLKAIAKESGVTQYSSKEFIGKYKLGTPSSVNRSLTTLLDKEMIYEESGIYKVYDLFFANWLMKR